MIGYKGACMILLVLGIFIMLCLLIFDKNHCESEAEVDISNSSCSESLYIGRSLFFHQCIKDNKTVFDIRYFWKENLNDRTLKADIIGVQMSVDEFLKICNVLFKGDLYKRITELLKSA